MHLVESTVGVVLFDSWESVSKVIFISSIMHLTLLNGFNYWMVVRVSPLIKSRLKWSGMKLYPESSQVDLLVCREWDTLRLILDPLESTVKEEVRHRVRDILASPFGVSGIHSPLLENISLFWHVIVVSSSLRYHLNGFVGSLLIKDRFISCVFYVVF